MPHLQPIRHHFRPLTHCLDVSDPVWKAWRTMKENDVKRLPVKRNDKIIGIVSDRDIVQISGYNGGQSMPVKEAMSLDPLVLTVNDSLKTAIEAMLVKEQQHAVVLNEAGQVCGLFSWDIALEVFLDICEKNRQQKQA